MEELPILQHLKNYCIVLDQENATEDLPIPPNANDMSIHAGVYAVADKYNLSTLKETTRDKFRESMDLTFSGTEFFEALDIAFTTTPEEDDGLRDLIATRLAQEEELYCMHELLKHALQTTPGLAWRVMCRSYPYCGNINAKPWMPKH